MLPTILAYVLVALFFVIERTLRQGREAKRLRRGAFDQGSTLVVGGAFLVSVLSLALALFLTPTLPLALRWLGILLMIGGLALRVWAYKALGRFYTRTLLVSEHHEIVRQGPYALIRHPGYLGILAMWVGAGLATGSVIVLLVLALVDSLAYAYRIRAEETMLVNVLGAQYQDYRAHSWRLIPYVY